MKKKLFITALMITVINFSLFAQDAPMVISTPCGSFSGTPADICDFISLCASQQ